MSQLEPTMTPAATPIPDAMSRRSFVPVAGAIALVAAILLAGALISVGFRPAPTGSAAGDVTDGWMHGTAALPVTAGHGANVTDGWAGRYLPSAQTVNVTDGWAGRYLPSAQTVNVTDGWAGRYLH